MTRSSQPFHHVLILFAWIAVALSGPALAEYPPVEEAEEKEPIEVFAEPVEQVDIFDPLVFGGFVEAEARRVVAGEIAGTIVDLKVKPGSKVRRGQTLFSIQPASAGLQYQTHRVASPAAGVVTDVLKPEGEPISAGSPVLAIEDLSNLKVGIEVTARDLSHLQAKPAMMAVAFAGSPEEATVPAKLEVISPKASATTGTFRVDVALDCPKDSCPAAFRLGSLVRVVLKTNLRQGIKVPLKWLYSQRRKVLVLEPDNTVKWVEVKLGKYYGEQVEVLEGVKAGMTLVTSFADRPEEGDAVKVIPKEPVGGAVAAGAAKADAPQTN